MKNEKVFGKLYVSCRRGMLELDIILLNFIKFDFFNFDLKFLNDFSLFLKKSDNDLYSYLLKNKTSYKYKKIINRIKFVNMFFI